MKNFLGLFLLLSLAGQPHAQASEATDNSIPSAVTHHSGNTSDTSIEDLLKLRKKYPLKPAKATKAEVQRAIDFIKTFDTAKMETVKIEDTRKLAAAIRALAYAAQENLPEGSEFSPYLDKVLNDGVIERIPAFPYNSYTDVRVVPVDFLSALPVCTPEQQGRLIESVKGLMEFYKLNQKDAILKRTVNSDYLYNVLPHLFVCALHNPDNAQAAEDLRSFSRYLSACTQYVPGEKDILKPDGTGFHHKTHYNGYMYSYRTWVEYMGRLKGTAFRITRDAYQRMSKAIVSVYLMATSSASDTEHFYANSLAGRHPLYGLDVNFSKALFRELVEIGGDMDGKEFDPELAAYYNAFFKTDHYKGVTPRKLDGFYQFNYSPAGIYRQANWVATMRCPTTRFWGGEIYNKTNRFGRYQSHGTLEVLYEGSLAASGYPYKNKKSAEKGGWDWNVMPGTTTVHYTDWKSMLPNGNNADRFDQWSHTTNFAGALAWGDCGLFAAAFDQDDKWGSQRFVPTHLSFCKSVFAIDGMLFSMGSGVSAQGEYPDDSHQLVPKRYGRQGLNDSQRQTVGRGRFTEHRLFQRYLDCKSMLYRILHPCRERPAYRSLRQADHSILFRPYRARYGNNDSRQSISSARREARTKEISVPCSTCHYGRTHARRRQTFCTQRRYLRSKTAARFTAHREAHTFAHNRIRFVCPCHRAE